MRAKKARARPRTRRGWLDDDDLFFRIIDQVVSDRERHKPRALAAVRRRGTPRGRR